MRSRLPLIYFLLICVPSLGQTISSDTVWSPQVNDHYVITIRKPDGFDPKKNYHHVYITDGSLGIGDYILGKDKSWAADVPGSCVIFAISHIGNWHEKRNRDFVPSDQRKNNTGSFGNAVHFYYFLQNELVPWVERKIPNKKDRSFIGHSLGGLFCVYALFKEERLFDYHFAISPSLWANYYEMKAIEAEYWKSHKQLPSNLFIYAGGLEFANKVLPSSRAFYNTLVSRKYGGLDVTKKEFADANHFSVRKPAVDKIFEFLKDQ